jgi:hypothetical protein
MTLKKRSTVTTVTSVTKNPRRRRIIAGGPFNRRSACIAGGGVEPPTPGYEPSELPLLYPASNPAGVARPPGRRTDEPPEAAAYREAAGILNAANRLSRPAKCSIVKMVGPNGAVSMANNTGGGSNGRGLLAGLSTERMVIAGGLALLGMTGWQTYTTTGESEATRINAAAIGQIKADMIEHEIELEEVECTLVRLAGQVNDLHRLFVTEDLVGKLRNE